MNFDLGIVGELNTTLRITDEANNQSVLLTGESGSGKTFGMNRIIHNVARSGGAVVVLNYANTFPGGETDELVSRRDIRREGLPASLFRTIMRPDGTQEDYDDLVEDMLEMFNETSRLFIRQRSALRRALEKAFSSRQNGNLMERIKHELRDEKGKSKEEIEASKLVLEKYYILFRQLKVVGSEAELFQKGHILVLDLCSFSSSVQYFVAELIMAAVWREYRAIGIGKEFSSFLVCDEFQSLNLKQDSVLSQILREGRKHHLSLLLATQTLAIFNPGQVATIMQPATKLFFKPSGKEARHIARLLCEGDVNVNKLEQKFQKLRRGECIASGQFCAGNLSVNRPIKLYFT